MRLLGARITSLNTEGNLANRYHSIAAVRKKTKIKATMTTGAGGDTYIHQSFQIVWLIHPILKLVLVVDVADWLYPFITPAKSG